MIAAFDYFRQLNIESIALRLILAMVFGGLIGLEGGRKGRAAGFRTYMLVCMGASLTIVLGLYESEMLHTHWLSVQQITGTHVDVARFGAQVINGIGFLGAGTIIVTKKQQVKGPPPPPVSGIPPVPVWPSVPVFTNVFCWCIL